MSESIIPHLIMEKAGKMGYKSVTCRLALIQEQDGWKIFNARFVFDIIDAYGQKTLFEQKNFVLEDFSLSIDDFNKFLDYLNKVFVGNVKFQDSTFKITNDLLYKFGNYKLCFVGNFPGRELYFFRSEIGQQHGFNKSLYFTDYSLNDSVRAKAYQHIDLTGGDIPLADPLDAVNHFWQANFEPFQISSSCPIYLPIYDAHITSCKYDIV